VLLSFLFQLLTCSWFILNHAEIAEFLVDDQLDDEANLIAQRFLSANNQQ